MPDSHPDTEAGRWLTYRQIADLRRISKASAERLVRRHKWRRQEDNQGATRALVPPEWADADPDRLTDSPPDIRPDIRGDGAPDITPSIAAFEAALAAIHGAKDAEISTLRQANATLREQLAQSVTLIDGFREERDRTEVSLSAANARADALRDRLDSLLHDLDAAHQQARHAQQAADALRWAEKARQGRGRLARVLAAWRGE
jgi:hypothetical protein